MSCRPGAEISTIIYYTFPHAKSRYAIYAPDAFMGHFRLTTTPRARLRRRHMKQEPPMIMPAMRRPVGYSKTSLAMLVQRGSHIEDVSRSIPVPRYRAASSDAD